MKNASNVEDWIRKRKTLNLGYESREFVETLENGYPGLKAELDLVYRDVKLDTKEELIKNLEKEDCVLVMCDKSMGMSLFSLETMRKADETLMRQLGAVRMGETKEEIMRNVIVEIERFENGLTSEQREFMDSSYESRQCCTSKVMFPFLKSLHKIQKMTEEEINNKDLTELMRNLVDLVLGQNYAETSVGLFSRAC